MLNGNNFKTRIKLLLINLTAISCWNFMLPSYLEPLLFDIKVAPPVTLPLGYFYQP